MKTTIIDIILSGEGIQFANGYKLKGYHFTNCCEHHWLDFTELDPLEYQNLEFDLSNDSFFEKIESYGIALIPLNGHRIRIPGYGSNNGYYSSKLTLILVDETDKVVMERDISECQEWEDDV